MLSFLVLRSLVFLLNFQRFHCIISNPFKLLFKLALFLLNFFHFLIDCFEELQFLFLLIFKEGDSVLKIRQLGNHPQVQLLLSPVLVFQLVLKAVDILKTLTRLIIDLPYFISQMHQALFHFILQLLNLLQELVRQLGWLKFRVLSVRVLSDSVTQFFKSRHIGDLADL